MEIQRLIEDAIRHQGRVVRMDGGDHSVPILPIVLERQFRDQMLSSLEMLIDLCKEQLSKSIEILERESGGQPLPKAILSHK